MDARYRVLRLLGRIYRILAYLGVLLGVAGILHEFLRSDLRSAKDVDVLKALVLAVATAVQFVVLYGMSEAVALLLAISSSVQTTERRAKKLLDVAFPEQARARDEADDGDDGPIEDIVLSRCERCDMRVLPGKKLCPTCRRVAGAA